MKEEQMILRTRLFIYKPRHNG